MGDRTSRSQLSHGPVGVGMPRGLRPYKRQPQYVFVPVLFVVLMIAATMGLVTGGRANWTLVFPWLMVPCSTYCFVRERASKTVIPGAYWGLGQVLSALAAMVLLLVLY